jgi:glycosyltransferase involved in cell wall biosynthesis
MLKNTNLQIDNIYPGQRSLRIALVTETYPPDVNGVAQTIARIVEGLRQRGHELMLIRPRQTPDHLAASGSTGFDETLVRGMTIPVYRDLKMGLPASSALTRMWRLRRPDLVHITTEGPLGWSATRVARKMRIPSTSDFRTNFHAYSQFYGLGWLNGAIVAYMRKFHNATSCTMVPTRELLAQLGNSGFQRLHHVPRGVDVEQFTPAKRSTALRNAWGAAASDIVLLSVGRLAPEKNLDMVVRAWEDARAAGVPVKLVFVGDGPLRPALEQRCPGAIFAGTRRHDDLAAHYASADLFVFPSLTETFGNVTLEAMASGLGVVSYRCAAAAELIHDGINGTLAAPGDETEFLAQTTSLAQNAELLARMRLAARQTAISQDWQRIVQQTESVMQATLAAGAIAGA